MNKKTPTKGFDLADLKPTSEVIEVPLVHPANGDPLMVDDKQMYIVIYAPHSKVYKQAQHDEVNKRIKAAQKGKKNSFTSEEVEQSALELLAKITKEWFIVLGGETPQVTQANAITLYQDFPWIKTQVEEAIGDAANFTKV